MRRYIFTFLTIAVLITFFTVALAWAQDGADDEDMDDGEIEEVEVDFGVDKGLYEYATAKDIDFYIRMEERIDQMRSGEEAQQFRKFIGKHVTFCDELSIFWDELEDIGTAKDVEDMSEKGYIDDYDNQEFLKSKRFREKYYKFETYYFRCVIPKSKNEVLEKSVAYLRYVNQVKNERRLVMICGKVQKLAIWLPVDNTYGAKEAGTTPEQIFIVVDKLERPRERFFEEWLKNKK